MVCKLSHSCDQGENVGIVVQHDTFRHILVEFSLGIRVQTLVQILLLLVEKVSSDLFDTRWQPQVVCSFHLSTSQHNITEQSLDVPKRFNPITSDTVFLDVLQHEMVEEVGMLHRNMSTLITMAPVCELPLFGTTGAFNTEILAKWFNVKKPNQRVDLPNTVLERLCDLDRVERVVLVLVDLPFDVVVVSSWMKPPESNGRSESVSVSESSLMLGIIVQHFDTSYSFWEIWFGFFVVEALSGSNTSELAYISTEV
ncbi:hypothetical protein WICPIJ_006688 [Wickerhamomyces pijperi]|uniref:Uncharacterized protein n=1 Tax=Wickerhamomyces pijperi TaxID=599730 RepID=A0A9P8Q3Z3_WICPI|nr:hypothetical protein WICPIJ_006688 [Wickerhamomyces pijperi]